MVTGAMRKEKTSVGRVSRFGSAIRNALGGAPGDAGTSRVGTFCVCLIPLILIVVTVAVAVLVYRAS